MMWGNGWDNWFVGFLMMALFWGGLLVLAVLALRAWGRSEHSPGSSEQPADARAILDERFAKGEISEEEFQQRRRVLEHAGK